MNDDIQQLMSRANPEPHVDGYAEHVIEANIAAITRHAELRPSRPVRRRPRRGVVAAVAFVVVAAAGMTTASAAGWLSPQVSRTFDNPTERQSLIQLYGSAADLGQAKQRVQVPGPDGTTLSLWTVPVAARGLCSAILLSAPSGQGTASGFQPSVGCVDDQPAVGLGWSTSAEWRSPRTGTDYSVYGGSLGTRTGIVLRVPGHPTQRVTSVDGYYLTGAVRTADLTCASLTAVDAAGRPSEPARYLSDSCPTDPFRTPPTAPASTPTPASTP